MLSNKVGTYFNALHSRSTGNLAANNAKQGLFFHPFRAGGVCDGGLPGCDSRHPAHADLG